MTINRKSRKTGCFDSVAIVIKDFGGEKYDFLIHKIIELKHISWYAYTSCFCAQIYTKEDIQESYMPALGSGRTAPCDTVFF